MKELGRGALGEDGDGDEVQEQTGDENREGSRPQVELEGREDVLEGVLH